jgi:digeranylgeranylglycerophospholipid reductase
MNKAYDVIVVGAGPAGSLAAKHAALGGVSTLLIEKHPVIGCPVCCAEAISTTGLTNIVEPDPRWICSEIERVRLHGPGNSKAGIYHPKAGFVLERKIFDRAMAEQAAIAGADVKVGVDALDIIRGNNGDISGVVADDNGRSVEIGAKVVIAADGVESQIACRAGLNPVLKPKDIHSSYQYLIGGIELEPRTLEFYFGNETAPGGYIWVFGKGGGLANVGLAIMPTKSPHKKAVEYLDEFIARRFSRYKIIERMTGGVPTYMEALPLYKDNLLLCGDAARVIDSLTGAGIANALLSGKLAGQTAARMVREGISGEFYRKEFLKIKGRELKFYYLCRQIYLKLSDDDVVNILRFVDDIFGEKEITGINPFEVITKIIMSHPKLLTLGRHLLTMN